MFKKYDVIVQDYVNRIDYLNNRMDGMEDKKLSKEMLNTEVMNFKRIVKNIEVKARKYIGISEEEWEGFVPVEEIK